MPEVRALKTFQSRYGLMRAGTLFQCAPDYLKALLKNRLVEVAKPIDPSPNKNRSVPEAPNKGGKDAAATGTKSPGTEQPPDSGEGATSSSAQAGPASRKKTSRSSEGGAITSKSIDRRRTAQKKTTTPDA